MKTETMLATEKMLDVVKTLLDEEQPESLFSKILEVAKGVLRADAAVLDISGETPLHFSNPEQVSISISAVRQAKSEPARRRYRRPFEVYCAEPAHEHHGFAVPHSR